jgi:hypothetical protein
MEGEKYNNYQQENNDFSDSSSSQQNFPSYNQVNRRKEKISSILIFSIGLFALIFGVFSFWFTVSNPFLSIFQEGERVNQEILAKRQAEIESLKNVDTDGDGLSDYEELYVYGTSPYLKDSDGDGTSDYDEVKTNRTDPNCPEGMVCSGLPTVMPNLGFTSTDPVVFEPLDATITVPLLTTNPDQVGTQIKPDFIRSLMRQNGATEEEMAELTDEVIMAEFRQYLRDNPEISDHFKELGMDVEGFMNPTGNLNISSLSDIGSIEDLKALSGAQIRQLMINSGSPESVLNAINDEQLKLMFLQRLGEQFE